jgi:hypothetical protein
VPPEWSPTPPFLKVVWGGSGGGFGGVGFVAGFPFGGRTGGVNPTLRVGRESGHAPTYEFPARVGASPDLRGVAVGWG